MERDLFKDKQDKYVVGFLKETIEYGGRWVLAHGVALHARTMYVYVKFICLKFVDFVWLKLHVWPLA